VSICVRAGLPKPRLVPDTERIKDTKTLDCASTPLDANTLLPAVYVDRFFVLYFVKSTVAIIDVQSPLLCLRFLLKKFDLLIVKC
jgi:hypothetical protein